MIYFILISGTALNKLGKFYDAILMFNHAIFINPDSEIAYINKGFHILIHKDKFYKANKNSMMQLIIMIELFK